MKKKYFVKINAWMSDAMICDTFLLSVFFSLSLSLYLNLSLIVSFSFPSLFDRKQLMKGEVNSNQNVLFIIIHYMTVEKVK